MQELNLPLTKLSGAVKTVPQETTPVHPLQDTTPVHPLQETTPVHPLQDTAPAHLLQETTPALWQLEIIALLMQGKTVLRV